MNCEMMIFNQKCIKQLSRKPSQMKVESGKEDAIFAEQTETQ